MIALCLGGAPSVWSDLSAAKALLAGRPYLTIACNFAGERYPDHLDAWATLHPEYLPTWKRRRKSIGGNHPRLFCHIGHSDSPDIEPVPERFKGSSGLYMAQIAFEHLNATGVILCGVPMEQGAGHIHWPGPWSDPERYRGGL